MRSSTLPSATRVAYVDVAAMTAAELSRCEGWLEPEELAKAARMATADLRAEHVVTRALARWILSRDIPDVAPDAWRFSRTEAGRPYVVGPRTAPFDWNLSNAGGVVVGASSRYPVGVDVEPRARGTELVASAVRMFSDAENDALARLPPAARAARAVELWTLKEAFLKARGVGISVRLSRFSIAAVGDGRYELSDVGALGEAPDDWQLEIRQVCGEGADCVIAVAIRRGAELDTVLELERVVPA